MDQGTFNEFRNLIYEKSGISLKENKLALVCARVSKRMRTLGIEDYRDYLKEVTKERGEREVIQLLNNISTNVTSFFRENEHFNFFSKKVQAWIDDGQTRFRFWSAGCSTGEEPYSMSISLHENVSLVPELDIKILATDISTLALEKCKRGVYSSKKFENMPAYLRSRYFKCIDNGKDVSFCVDEKLRQNIVIKRLNLSQTPFPMRGPLDIVFCRNVMIYFDNTVRENLLAELYRLLRPKGYLIVGHAESLTGIKTGFKGVEPSIYIKP